MQLSCNNSITGILVRLKPNRKEEREKQLDVCRDKGERITIRDFFRRASRENVLLKWLLMRCVCVFMCVYGTAGGHMAMKRPYLWRWRWNVCLEGRFPFENNSVLRGYARSCHFPSGSILVFCWSSAGKCCTRLKHQPQHLVHICFPPHMITTYTHFLTLQNQECKKVTPPKVWSKPIILNQIAAEGMKK